MEQSVVVSPEGEVTETSVMKAHDAIVLPAVSPEAAKEAWKKYQELKEAIKTPEDIQHIQGKDFLKKSFWKKCATFFNLSVEMVSENRTSESDGSVTFETIYKATAPNGRSCTGDGACNTREKGRDNSVHNTRSTAHTRASNRAISNLVGGGEVTADEITEEPIKPIREEIPPNMTPNYKEPPVESFIGENYFQLAQVVNAKVSTKNANFWSLKLDVDEKQVYWNLHMKDWNKALHALDVQDFPLAIGKYIEVELEQNGKFLNVAKYRKHVSHS